MFHSVPSRVREKHHDCLMQCDLEAVCCLSRCVHTSSERTAVWKSSSLVREPTVRRKPALGITHLIKSLFLNVLLEGNAFAIFCCWPVLLLFSFRHAGTFGQFKINFPLGIYHPTDYSELEYIFFSLTFKINENFLGTLSTPQFSS